MEKAREMSNTGKTVFKKGRLVFFYLHFDWFAGLTTCYFARQTGDKSQMVDAQDICDRLKHFCNDSRWNFENKHYLLKAECHFTEGEISQAAEAYEASIKAAKDHKFINEMALSCELAGYFFKEQGNEEKARAMFKQARDGYVEWGAIEKAKLVPQ